MRFIAYLSALTNKGGVYKYFTNDLLAKYILFFVSVLLHFIFLFQHKNKAIHPPIVRMFTSF